MGLVATSWNLGSTPSVGDVCGSSRENEVLTLKCLGGKFTDVAFASFGTPSGSCMSDGPAPTVNATCNAPSTVDTIRKLCVGKATCDIDVTPKTFGPDPWLVSACVARVPL